MLYSIKAPKYILKKSSVFSEVESLVLVSECDIDDRVLFWGMKSIKGKHELFKG